MISTRSLVFCLLLLPTLTTRAADPQILPLWPAQPPGDVGIPATEEKFIELKVAGKPYEVAGRPTRWLTNVTKPTITIYPAPKETNTHAAMIICPGGGYHNLGWDIEGEEVAAWLNSQGITGVLLKYRCPRRPGDVKGEPPLGPLIDAQRALRLTRARAADWSVDPQKIGIIGFSAGGHLTSSVATHYTPGDPNAADPVDRVSSRPDLQIVIYPVIKMTGPDAHAGSRRNLFGDNPDPKLLDEFTNNKVVNKDTPPAFIVHSTTDKTVPVSNSDDYAAALREAGVDYEYVRLDHYAHGFGLKDDWTVPCADWLKRHKF